jgi:maltose alpha-D-glucosyltransferase/alpha-amylase
MAFHFPLMPRIFMAVALEDRYPIAEIMRQTPDIPDNCQWAIFLRNHDELTLEMVTDRERDYMYKMYAQEPRMRVNVGIRRRLAPLLNNDVDRIKLMYSLLLSMPGSPIVYYGDEIGMGDNIYIGDRNGVRTPMQWSIDRNAGFSRTDPQRLYLPIIMDPIYGYQAVNVEAQSRDPSSLLNWTRRILAIRRQYKAFGRGTLEFIRPQNRKIIAYVRRYDDEIVLCVANLAQSAQAVELDLSQFKAHVPVELSGRNAFPPIGDLPYFLTLPAHAFFWLSLSEAAQAPSWHVERLPASELPVLVLTNGIQSLLGLDRTQATRAVVRRTLEQLEREVLPEFMRMRGWARPDPGAAADIHLGERLTWHGPSQDALLTFVYAQSGEERRRFALPLTLAWDDVADSEVVRTAEWTLAQVREHSRIGVLVDAFADPDFCAGVVRSIAESQIFAFTGGRLSFQPTNALSAIDTSVLKPVQIRSNEQYDTKLILAERVVLKAYRLAEPGINPDIEMADLLTRRGFNRIAPLVGTVVCEIEGQASIALASAHAHIGNQGDAWTFTLDHLDRFAGELRSGAAATGTAAHTLFFDRMKTMGRCVGELHAALCAGSDEPAFTVEPLSASDLQQVVSELEELTQRIVATANQTITQRDESTRTRVERLAQFKEPLIARLRSLASQPVRAVKMRHHGNLQLQRVLLAADDFLITDFDGVMTLPLEERRRKHSPLRDVASILASLRRAAGAALQRTVSVQPDLADRMEPALEVWRAGASDAFLAGYRRVVGQSNCIPETVSDTDRLLRLFEFEYTLRCLKEDLDHGGTSLGRSLDALLLLMD